VLIPPCDEKDDAGYYHTHPGEAGEPQAESFSGDDMDIADRRVTPAYVGTPSGAMRKYTPKWPLDNGRVRFPRTGTHSTLPQRLKIK